MRRGPFVLSLFMVLGTLGCAAVVQNPYQAGVQAALAHDTMRTLTTTHIEMQYPEGYRAGAEQLASRMETCITQLSALVPGGMPRDRLSVVYTSANFNNAYVTFPSAGQPFRMVLPVHETLEFFNLVNIGVADVPQISCHESVHYLTSMQTNGFWESFNSIFGNAYAPVSSLPLWVHEGMATFYEGQLGGEFGRPKSLLWRGQFEAGVVARGGDLRPGDLDPGKRALGAYGAHYLVGMHFVEYLAHRYGDAKLWELIKVQSESLFSPFGITLRFKQVFGGDLDELFGEFTDHLKSTMTVRERPPTQRVIAPDLGFLARVGTCRADGAIITVTDDADALATLTVRERDGTVRFSRWVTDVLPVREQVQFSGSFVSGIDCSADGRTLYYLAADLGDDGNYRNKLWALDAHTGQLLKAWSNVPGIGGGVRPDGHKYAYVALHGAQANIAEIDLETGEHTSLRAPEGASSLGAPTYSPDGARLAFAARTATGFNLFVRDADGTLNQLTDDGGDSYLPRWLSPDEVVFVREHNGRLQAHRMNVTSGEVHAVSDVPYALLDAVPVDKQHLVILNAEGWGFSLDEVTLPPSPTAAVTTDAPTPPPLPVVPEEVQEEEPASESAPTAASAALTTPAGPDMHLRIPSRADQPATIVSDTPYNGYGNLLKPTLILPYYYWADDGFRVHNVLGLAVEGQDILAYHVYAMNLFYDFVLQIPNINATYVNYTMAPWQWVVSLQQMPTLYNVEQVAQLTLQRSIWTNQVSASLVGLKRRGRAGVAGQDVQIWGPSVGLVYSGYDTTPYAGVLREMQVLASTAVYPAVPGVGEDKTLIDVRLELDGAAPLPLSRRHSLRFSVVARQVLGTSEPLLFMGGGGSVGPISDVLSLSEYVRGYALVGWNGGRVGIGGASYLHPFIIDAGFNSFLWIFPQLFIRQVTLEVFCTAAWSQSEVPLHRAAGVALSLPITIGGLPLAPGVQWSYRFDEFPGREWLVNVPFTTL